MQDTLAAAEEPLSSGLRHSLDGGKRIRPALVILTGQMFTICTEPFYSLAAAVEMMHTATLIHDDLLDGAQARRGRRTLHTVWPTRVAVLAGDYLLAQAASLIADLAFPPILKLFAETLCTICAGEVQQTLVARGELTGREDYYRSIDAKTASLFAATTEMAGILAGASEPQIAELRRFGRGLGRAFQIVDDVLDFVGDEAQLGKPSGSDLRQGLITLPTICYLEGANDNGVVSAILAGRRDEEHVRAAVEAIRSSGAVDVALAEARAHAGVSQKALARLPNGDSRRILSSLTGYLTQRRT
jgi:geranylgeranyl pyrophosphate synthase